LAKYISKVRRYTYYWEWFIENKSFLARINYFYSCFFYFRICKKHQNKFKKFKWFLQ
jgi:hypothetical protein